MRIFSRRQLAHHSSEDSSARWSIHGGDEDLEVVGEASYQDALWSLCGGSLGDRVRHDIVAVLIPEPENPHDANAITVCIEGSLVGYLPLKSPPSTFQGSVNSCPGPAHTSHFTV